MHTQVGRHAALGLLVGIGAVGCRSEPARPARDHAEVVRALGGDPSTARTTTARDEGGQPVAVTTFQAQAPTGDELAGDRAACAGGDLAVCVRLGDRLQGLGDYAGAERAWAPACDGKVAEACHELGNMLTNPYLKLGRETEGVARLEQGCALGAGASCYFLGQRYTRGDVVAADPARARTYYQRGCDLGHHWACEAVHAPAR